MVTSRNDFDSALAEHNTPLQRAKPEILQLNVGKLCNLTCVHCHVNAGPKRREIISRETIDRVLGWLESTTITRVDLTGGTPEMIPDFCYLIERLRAMTPQRHIMDRLNATILMEEGYEGMADFLAKHEIELIASMPCYSPDNVTEQRGQGVFDSSIAAFQKLNHLGYGRESRLKLHFVYNPNGAFLPPEQSELHADYTREMKQHFGIEFNDLYAITNMPIARFASYLKHNNLLKDYLIILKDAFNPATVNGLMCRNTINVSWRGEIFDCDFNQMMNLPLNHNDTTEGPHYLWDSKESDFDKIAIRTGVHCFGCTAGAGSSCGGTLA